MQEGVASEAASLAGHLQLGNLIAIYDDNHITIDGNTNVSFTEDVVKRFEAYGWHTEIVTDGDNDLEGIEAAIKKCQAVKDKPSMIKLRTIIGYGSKLEGTHGVHGAPLKTDDIKQLKTKFGFNPEQTFVVPQEVYDLYNKKGAEGAALEKEWEQLFAKYGEKYQSEVCFPQFSLFNARRTVALFSNLSLSSYFKKIKEACDLRLLIDTDSFRLRILSAD